MATIMQTMRKGEAKRNIKAIAEKQLLQLELRLIYAKDFTHHKVAYYEQQIAQHKKAFNL